MTGTVAEALLANAAGDGGGEFLRLQLPGGDDRVLTYAELIDEASRWRGFYAERGLGAGDRVIVVLRHSLDLYAAYAGALLGGQVPAMFAFPSAKFSEEEYFRTVGTLLAGAHAKLLVTYPELAAKLRARERGTLGDTTLATAADAHGREPAAAEPPVVDPASPAFLQYSSGTTGIKKGVAVSHEALAWQLRAYGDAIGAGEGDRIVSWLPLYHDMGLIACFFLPLLRRVPLVAMSPFDWVQRPAMWVEAASDHRATLSWLPNFAYNFLAANVRDEDLDGRDLSSLRGVVNCSEPILASSHERFLARFGPYGLRADALAASYALAENTFAATSGGFGSPPRTEERDGRMVVGSGRPLPETEVTIVDADGSPVEDGVTGEILLRSPCLMTGYDGNAEATRAAFDAEGRYRTRDLGYVSGGELFVTGRKQDLVIVGGRNIYPQDVEAVTNEVAGVLPGRVVAFGVPQEERGTEALVVLAETEAREPEEVAALRSAVREAVVAHADLVPADVQLLPPRTLVKSTAGKISRSENRRRYLEEWGAAEALPGPGDDDAVRRAVLTVVAARGGAQEVADDTPLVGSGLLDSFATAELLSAVETAAGRAIPPEALLGADVDTIGGILALVRSLDGPAPAVTREADASAVQATASSPVSRPAGHRLRSLALRLRLRARGARVGRRLTVVGPVLLEILGDARNLEIGDDVVLMPGVHLKLRERGRIVLGDGVKLDTGARLVAANDARIDVGARAAVGPGNVVNAGVDVTIGPGSMSAAYCVLNASDHGMAAGVPMRDQPFEHAPIAVGADVWIGAGAFVAKGATIGDGAVVSAGAVVSGVVPPGAIVQGRPARVVGYRG